MGSQNEIIIKEYLKTQMGFNEKRVLQEYEGIKNHSDIEAEFAKYIVNGWNNEDVEYISVEGFSARKLYGEYPLSVFGAYNYLIYLREEPEEALNFLRKGLPSK